jgi:hypothetical protein
MPDAKQTCCSKQEMQEVRAREAQQGEKEKICSVSSLKMPAQIKDQQWEEDGEWHTCNQSQGKHCLIHIFQP